MIGKDIELSTGRTITWGDPANPEIGIIKAISQNKEIFFMMRITAHNQPLYTTIERREILGVVDDPI